MKYQLSQIFDIEELKKLCESFAQFSGIANAIIDLEGNIFVAAGWLPICTQFHQINKKTLNQCLESTTILAGPMHNGQKYNIYECKNGLMDIAIPIMVNHEHIGNFFLGQFLTKKPDIEFFKKQAKTYGFNESDYLSALEQVPVLSEEQIEKTNNFIMLLTETIGNLGLKNFQNLEYLKRLETGQQQLKDINEEIEQQNREIILSKAQAEESEEKYRLLHENAGIGIGYYSPEGIVISYNSLAAKNMDGVPEDFIGKSIFDIFPKPDAEFYFERIKKAIASDEIEIYEDFIQLPGTKKWFISTFTKILNSQGDLLGIQIISQDISTLKNAEFEAKQSQVLSKTIIDSIPGTFYMIDVSGKYVGWNTYQRDEIVGQPESLMGEVYAINTIHPDDRLIVGEKISNVLKIGVEEVVEGRVLLRGGPDYRWFLMTGCRMMINDSPVLIGTGIDITERKLAEESLAIKNAAIESAISAIGIADLEGNIIYANPAFVRLWVYSDVGEIIGKHISGFAVSKEQVSEVVRTLQAGSPYKGEGISLKMDGTTFHTSLTANLVTSADGKPVCMMASFLDITDRKRAEEELVEKNIELERQYEEYVQLNEVLRETNYGLEFAIKKAEENEEKYRLLIDNINDLICEIDENGFYTFVSRNYKEILGYEKDELIGKKAIDLLHPEDLKTSITKYEDIKNSLNKSTDIWRFKNKKGEYRIIESKGTVYLNTLKQKRTVVISRDITEQKQTFDRIEAMAGMLDVAPNSITIHDTEGNFLYANQKTYEIHGYCKNEFMKINLHELDVPESEALLAERFDLIEKQGYASFEVSHYRKNKSIFPLEIFAKKVIWQGQKAILSIATDITQRKEYIQKLNESEEKYRLLIENSHDIIYTLSKEGVFTFVSPAWTALLGHPLDKVIGHSFAPFVHSEDIPYCLEWLQKIIETGQRQEGIEYRVKHSNGTWFWHTSSAVPLRDESGTIIGFEGTARDITDRKQAELKNQLLTSIIEKSQDFIGIATPDQNPIYVNSAGQKMVGIENEEILKETKIEDYFLPEDIPFLKNTIIPQLMKEGRWAGEFQFRHFKTNESIDVYYDLFLTEDPLIKEITNISTITRNITEQKNAEKELLKSKEKAEESDRLKTAFLQNMSHEIRTPLNGILGFSHLLQAEDISKEDIKEYTGIIQQSGNRLLNIINAVLDISKIETKQIAVSNKSFSLHSMLSDLYSFFTPIAAKKNLEMNYFIQRLNNNGLIDTDDIKLNQILTNLINNAIKFTQIGKIDFGYEVKGNCIEFFVRDTGIGISLEHQEKIFERFTQVDSKNTRCYEGVGLGLAICKGLVELLGGSIWVVSEADKGSTFYFSIPYQPAIETEKIKPVEDKTIDFPRKTILIAEDDETSFAYISKVLEKEQFNLLHAVNGEEAVQFVKNNPEIDFVLMDIRMPVMNGFEAAKLIKAMRPDLRIIAQTAYAFSQEREEILASGCDDYLSKPIDTLKLKKLLV